MRVSVFGSARLGEGTEEYGEAMRLGRMLAEQGHTILSGGYGGLMEAVSRGAHEGGGQVVGVTMSPWAKRLQPNRFLSEERAVETLFERIEILLESDCLIALRGGAGTLVEVGLAWNLSQMELMGAKPVILVGPDWKHLLQEFERYLVIGPQDLGLFTLANNVDDAATALKASFPVSFAQDWRG